MIGIEINYSPMGKTDLDILCMATIRRAEKFYKSPENVRAFEKWQKRRRLETQETAAG